MKKCRLLFVILVVSWLGTKAQETHFGVKGGPNYASIVGDLTEGIKFRFSGHLGLFAEIEMSDRFAFQPEIAYSSFGFLYSTDLFFIENGNPTIDGNDFRTAVRLNYLTLPLMSKFYLNDHFSVELGPQFGWLINQVTKTRDLDGSGASAIYTQRVSGDFTLDYGVAAGVEFHFNDQLSMAPRCYLGLRNRLNGNAMEYQNYNIALQLSLNYTFLEN